ncbi:hypothetical protein [Geobacillus genomosp. 3]|uniref:hypothetical protein n=1 Tax=Geobacillus genomosp. 3 TaxID=1921421 RepID=UPI001F20A4F4|nr:hypothetical protein [Geobacillus genomosp. 3]
MYHSHVHDAKQELMGLTGMLISRGIYEEPVDRNYVLLLQECEINEHQEKRHCCRFLFSRPTPDAPVASNRAACRWL